MAEVVYSLLRLLKSMIPGEREMNTTTGKVMVTAGHRQSNPGAFNEQWKVSEWQVTDIIARQFERRKEKYNYDVINPRRVSLLDKVDICNHYQCDFAIELHLNAFNGKASGSECLYWHTSFYGEYLAGAINDNLY